jgi:DNA invertase Pin-like site-specific DNA recombinase
MLNFYFFSLFTMSPTFYSYCRASTPHVAHPNHSLDGQKRALRCYAKKHGLNVSQVFMESSSAIVQRPIFNQMLQGLERGEANGILVHDINRLTRSATDGQRLIDMLNRGVITQITTPALILNKSTLMLHLSMQHQERDALSRSIKRGLRMRQSCSNLR